MSARAMQTGALIELSFIYLVSWQGFFMLHAYLRGSLTLSGSPQDMASEAPRDAEAA